MRVISWNACGQGATDCRMIVKDVLCSYKAYIAFIQNSKIRVMFDILAMEIWGIRSIKWECLSAYVSSVGILPSGECVYKLGWGDFSLNNCRRLG